MSALFADRSPFVRRIALGAAAHPRALTALDLHLATRRLAVESPDIFFVWQTMLGDQRSVIQNDRASIRRREAGAAPDHLAIQRQRPRGPQ